MEKEDAIVCDLDGTLALLVCRGPYDSARCELDELNEAVAHIVRTYAAAGVRVVLLSGREDRFRPHTRRWLARHDIPYDHLYLRPTKDLRKDALIKREIFERAIGSRYNVLFVLDDRDQVVEMWREMGLTCLQVAYGDF